MEGITLNSCTTAGEVRRGRCWGGLEWSPSCLTSCLTDHQDPEEAAERPHAGVVLEAARCVWRCLRSCGQLHRARDKHDGPGTVLLADDAADDRDRVWVGEGEGGAGVAARGEVGGEAEPDKALFVTSDRMKSSSSLRWARPFSAPAAPTRGCA